jgi:hypothetical protein
MFARIVALIGLVVAGQLWVAHHLGVGLDTPWITLVVATVSSALPAGSWLLDSRDKKKTTGSIRKRLRDRITWPLVASLYGMALLVAALFSSVTVLPPPAATASGSRLHVELRTADRKRLGTDDLGTAVVRFPVATTPFGRPVHLQVDGYLEQPVFVYPLLGVTVTPERDLRRSPTVLFRPPPIALMALESGGSFVVVAKQPAGDQTIVSGQHQYRGSFLIGRATTIPVANYQMWALELEGASFGRPVIARTVTEWSRPKQIKPTAELAPGMRLVAEVRTRDDNILVASADVTLGSESLIDVGMLKAEGVQ